MKSDIDNNNGIWWLPNNTRNKMAGIINFDNNAATLELVGTEKDFKKLFKDNYKHVTEKEGNIDLIFGYTLNNHKITLFDSKVIRQSGYKKANSAVYVYFIKSKYILTNAYFKSLDDIKFKWIRVYYPYLFHWTNISGSQDTWSQNSLGISYTTPEALKIGKIDDFSISINFSFSKMVNFLEDGTESSIKEVSYIGIVSDKDSPLSEFESAIDRFNKFLSLAYLQPMSPIKIEGFSSTIMAKVDGVSFPDLIGIYKTDNKKVDYTVNINMFFNYNDIAENLDTYLKNFIEKGIYLEPIYTLFFGILNNPYMTLENKFLNLAQAIESYHRRTMNNRLFDLDEFNAVETIILNAVPTKYTYWISGILEHSNEPPPSQRLTEIAKRYKRSINRNVINDKFFSKVVVTRNYLTHFDEFLKDKAATGDELYLITMRLDVLLKICILEELGFTKPNIIKIFNNQNDYGVFKRD